ncbi:MAG: ATP synthase F0 subunit B [Calditrichaeota bacterium]|nr:MAG: ATP synthase F0 subunit B [Calditrichota bacterium]
MLQLDPGMMIWTWVTFLVLLLVLRKVAWKPLLKAVEEREQQISESLRRAVEAREEAEKLLFEQQEKLAAAQEEVQQMIKESKAMAEKMRQDILEKAHQDAEKLVERAKADIERQRMQMINALRQEVANLVVDTTSKLVGVVVDEKKHRQIIDEAIAQFGQQQN